MGGCVLIGSFAGNKPPTGTSQWGQGPFFTEATAPLVEPCAGAGRISVADRTRANHLSGPAGAETEGALGWPAPSELAIITTRAMVYFSM